MPVLTQLRDVVEAMAGRPVLAVGDVMIDRFVYGDVHRISPESPVPVLTIRDETMMLGGVGNVLSNLHGLGVAAQMVGVTGNDRPAESLRRLAAEHGADPQNLITAADRPTIVKTRFLASHQQLLRTDFERNIPIAPATEKILLGQATLLLPRMGALILSDYGKGVLTPTLIKALIEKARALNIPVLVDPKGDDYTIYRGAAIVTPNKKELAEATGGMAVQSDVEIVAAARSLMERTGIDAVVATRSQDGMTIVQRNAEPIHLRTEALEVFDVSGAGDTVIATLAAALAAGADLINAATIANVAAGLVVAKVGTAPVRKNELLHTLDQKDVGLRPRDGGGAIVDTVREGAQCTGDEAAEIVARWRARGLRVGFTNGCFDILHQGHVSYLNRARDHCDRLVVALNSDASVRRLKGASRPVNDQTARAAIIAALGAVDMVVVFGEDMAEGDKPLRLIERLKPDLYFKGGDYKVEQLEEAPLVRAYGGTVAIMPLVKGHSTTATIKKLQGR